MRRSMTSFLTGLREAWGLARPYFTSEEKWSAIGLLAAVIGLNLVLTFLNVLNTYFQKYFYNSLQNHDLSSFLKLVFTFEFVPDFPFFIPGFAAYAAIFIVVAVYALYLNQMLQIRWRQWMTRDFSERWLADRAYYNISLAKSGTAGIDNPDQRISQDLAQFTANSLALSLDFISNLITLLSFITVLYAISGSIKLFGITIPGYMLWLAIIYSVVGTFITHRIGRKLINLNFNQQRVEADFRYSLIRVRDNPEAIALFGGEGSELITLRERFAAVRENWWAIMRRTKMLGFFTNGFNTFAGTFPIVAAAPRYFANLIQLGDLIQLSTVFGNVQQPLSWIVTSYGDLVNLRATISRLHGFQEAVAAARLAGAAGPQTREDGADLSLTGLTLTLPDGRKILDQADISLPPGEPIIITGPSGSGKSTLLRAIAGIWPHGSGAITRPANAKLLFLPQRPYFPLGTLKRAITYPAPEAEAADDAIIAALRAVQLENLIPRLAETENWSQILSGGEQQRLAIARALIAKPDWLFMDEATSALDAPLAAQIAATLRAALPDTTQVSITHRDMPTPETRHLSLSGGILAKI